MVSITEIETLQLEGYELDVSRFIVNCKTLRVILGALSRRMEKAAELHKVAKF